VGAVIPTAQSCFPHWPAISGCLPAVIAFFVAALRLVAVGGKGVVPKQTTQA
jgi:hypothetical protein